MNKAQEIKEAKKWTKRGGAYVKAVYGDGENGMIVSGDMVALIRIAERLISRIADVSGNGFVETWLTVKDMHNNVGDFGGDVDVINRGTLMPYEE